MKDYDFILYHRTFSCFHLSLFSSDRSKKKKPTQKQKQKTNKEQNKAKNVQGFHKRLLGFILSFGHVKKLKVNQSASQTVPLGQCETNIK